MNSQVACQICGSIDTSEIHSGTFAEWVLNMAGYQPCECKSCGFKWEQLLPLQVFFNLAYVILAVEIGFLLWKYLA
ncbi:MAG: hypothetical protein FD134_2815 [Gallionellaceae bacterium]|nr:MAG: hypothetical protein FD134_2815 [Gallionellaceae bacterium]